MAAPLLQAQVDIVAPTSNVWPLISDFRRMQGAHSVSG
jgi:hypothetical protein